jgi:hypothetical protein
MARMAGSFLAPTANNDRLEPMSNSAPDPSRLAHAIQLGLQFRDSGRSDVEAFLREHEDLRELLEPIVLGDQGEGVDESGADARFEPRGAVACGQSFGPYRLERELGRGPATPEQTVWDDARGTRSGVQGG